VLKHHIISDRNDSERQQDWPRHMTAREIIRQHDQSSVTITSKIIHCFCKLIIKNNRRTRFL